MTIRKIALAFTFALVATSAQAQDTGRRMQLVQQDIITFSSSGNNKADTCSSAINMARTGCMQQRKFNISRVSCECDGKPDAAGRWSCVGTAICQP